MNKYHVSTEIIIHAPIQKIWEVMIDVKKYGEWNRFIRKISADQDIPTPGTAMKFEVEFPNKSKATSGELVKLLEPPGVKEGKTTAQWVYDFTGPFHNIGMVRASRVQLLTAIDANTTHYYTCEKFRGWGKIFLPLKNVRSGFILHAEDLKKVCELKGNGV